MSEITNRFWRNVITNLKKEETDMTEDQAMKQMQDAINELNEASEPPVVKPQDQNQTVNSLIKESTHIRVAPQGLDAGRLVELARDRLQFARDRLNDIRREHTMKQFEIDAEYQRKIEAANREHEQAIASLDEQTARLAKPARDMIALVEKMLG
jgi:hypothetical protein